MAITKTLFGTKKDGMEVFKYTIENGNGMKVSFIDLGASITNIIVPDKDGNFEDVVLGYDNLEKYEVNVPSFGALIGRCANRISDCAFELNGERYELDNNNCGNTLHSGYSRLNFFMYEGESGADETGQYVRFSRVSPDGEQKFPGNLSYSVTYTLTEDNSLIIEYDAVTDKDTIFNMTNHSYFNIGPKGEAGENVLKHEVKIDSDFYTPVGKDILPTGEILPVAGTQMDFNEFKALGRDLCTDENAENFLPGYDHNFVLKNNGEIEEVAALRCLENGREMRVFTDLPGLQLYTAPALYEEGGKGNRSYGSSDAVCFETQFFPNAINVENFESPILKAGDEFKSTTIYAFGLM
ncbi:MAG: galactose mutarotase [Lachnospiraceae bacterium]|nr:galactose mutarotase [Lachnospiraceae bacterium]